MAPSPFNRSAQLQHAAGGNPLYGSAEEEDDEDERLYEYQDQVSHLIYDERPTVISEVQVKYTQKEIPGRRMVRSDMIGPSRMRTEGGGYVDVTVEDEHESPMGNVARNVFKRSVESFIPPDQLAAAIAAKLNQGNNNARLTPGQERRALRSNSPKLRHGSAISAIPAAGNPSVAPAGKQRTGTSPKATVRVQPPGGSAASAASSATSASAAKATSAAGTAAAPSAASTSAAASAGGTGAAADTAAATSNSSASVSNAAGAANKPAGSSAPPAPAAAAGTAPADAAPAASRVGAPPIPPARPSLHRPVGKQPPTTTFASTLAPSPLPFQVNHTMGTSSTYAANPYAPPKAGGGDESPYLRTPRTQRRAGEAVYTDESVYGSLYYGTRGDAPSERYEGEPEAEVNYEYLQ